MDDDAPLQLPVGQRGGASVALVGVILFTLALLSLCVTPLIGVSLLLGGTIWDQERATRQSTSTRTPHNTLAWLRAQPEDQLYYPGAVPLRQYGTDGYRSIGGGLDATAGTYLGVDAGREQVLSFYETQLRARGWRPGPYLGGLSTEIDVAYWQRDDLTLKIGLLYNDRPDSRLPAGATEYTTAYTVELWYTGTPRATPTP